METLETILSSAWLGTVLGIAGIVLTITFYWRSKNRLRVSFLQTSEMLIGGEGTLPKSVEVRCKGNVVPQLWRSSFVIWNSGNVTIDGDAVVKSDPLRVHLRGDNADVLSVDAVRVTRSVIGFQAAIESKEIIAVSFAFLDNCDGALITFLHTSGRPTLLGTIKGLPQGLEYRGSVESEGFKMPAGTSDVVLMLLALLWFGLAVALHLVVRVSKENSWLWSGIAVGLVLLFAIWKVMSAPRAPEALCKRPGDA